MGLTRRRQPERAKRKRFFIMLNKLNGLENKRRVNRKISDQQLAHAVDEIAMIIVVGRILTPRCGA